jgi:hypothetical protein
MSDPFGLNELQRKYEPILNNIITEKLTEQAKIAASKLQEKCDEPKQCLSKEGF